MLSILPGDRLWNRYRVEAVAEGGAWLTTLHEPATTTGSSRVLLLPLEREPRLAPLAELLGLAGAAARARRPRASGPASQPDASQELPLLGRVTWVGDPSRDGVALVAAPPARPLAEVCAAIRPLPACTALPLLTHLTGAMDALLRTLSSGPSDGPIPQGLVRALARLLQPDALALRTDNAQLTLLAALPDPLSAFHPPPWADHLAPELYRHADISAAACVFGAARLAAFLLSAAGDTPSATPEAAWARLAEWVAGKRDPAREFLESAGTEQVPAELRALLARCLARTPSRRVARLRKLRAALTGLAACSWNRASTLCASCGLALPSNHSLTACPCCGRKTAPLDNAPGQPGAAWPHSHTALSSGPRREANDRATATRAAVQAENMVLVNAGTFLSGEHKTPRTLRAFAIDTVPVSEGDYKRFLTATARTPRTGGPGSLGAEFDKHPATRVTWYEANEYAEFHGKRLPTIYEWEKAARGTDGRKFPFGSRYQPRHTRTRGKGAEKAGTVPAGSHPTGASPYGVLDAVGNVLQWTSTARRAGERLFRAVKGSCYLDTSPELARCSSVQYLPPETYEPYLGFRCVKDME